MKIRSGFVSNSSSSSFIVAVDNPDVSTKVKITLEVNLKDYTDETASTVEELKYWFLDNYCFDPDGDNHYGCIDYEKCLEQINQGKTVLFGSFTDECSGDEETMLCSEGLKGKVDEDKITIIQSEGGY